MLSLEEQATNYETLKHIRLVQKLIHAVVKDLLDRSDCHDNSKLESPELEVFTEHTSKLAGLTYDSEEYKAQLKVMDSALQHHYANNSHHPQFYKNGIDDMNLMDVIEMFCDWWAASKRHNDGNINKSIEINGKRFNMSQQLIRIFENTVKRME